MIGEAVIAFMVGCGIGSATWRWGFTRGRRQGDREGYERGLEAGLKGLRAVRGGAQERA